MKTFNSRTWRRWLVLASGFSVLAASYPFDEPLPVPAAMQFGHPPMPPTFSVRDIFRMPH